MQRRRENQREKKSNLDSPWGRQEALREENKIAGEGGEEVREDDGDGKKNMAVAGKGKPNQLITDPST